MSDPTETASVRPKRKRGRPFKTKTPLAADAPAVSVPEAARPELRTPSPRAPDPRAEFRASDPREEAARYIQAYEEHSDGNEQGVDRYKLDISIIPDAWDYNWKRVTTYNQPDPGYAAELVRHGWRPVLTGRHPELMPPGHPKETQIMLDGLGLFERPLELSARVRAKEFAIARAAVRAKEIQAGNAPQGTLDRTKPAISKEFAHVPIPRSQPQV